LLPGVLQEEAHVVVEEDHFLLSLLGILNMPELKIANVANNLDVAILYFYVLIKLYTFIVGL
jgi:hypothetical protein